MRSIVNLTLGLLLLIVISGCVNIAGPSALVGHWRGTYSNTVINPGTITAEFYMDGDNIRVIYELQGGEIRVDSGVRMEGRHITFGESVEGSQYKGDGHLNFGGTEITGTFTIDYALYGTRSGPLKLTKES
jgi:hypothetical protein